MGVIAHRSSRAFCMLRHVREVFPCHMYCRHSSTTNGTEHESPRSDIGDVKTKELKTPKDPPSLRHVDSLEKMRLKFCVVGSGPAGFYTVEKLVKRYNDATVDILERLPTPFGLVRSGVAPDHPETKNVINQFSRAAAQHQCNFFGNVELGRTVTLKQLQPLYHAVVLAYGAEGDRLLNIPGEDLQGVIAGREFVWWYNGHPDYKDFQVDLTSSDTAIILGQGNVALDIARILLRSVEDLSSTDIAEHALTALTKSKIRRVLIVGRRGPAQAACSARELRELLGVEGVEVTVREGELETTSTDMIEMKKSRGHKRVYELFTQTPIEGVDGGSSLLKQINFRFFRNPVELFPATNDSTRVGSVRFEKTELKVVKGSSRQQVAGRGMFENMEGGIVFRSIGYKSLPRPVEGLPFDHLQGIIPNVAGRVEGSVGSIEAGVYVVGWLKRGPSGIIGTNLTDAEETVSSIETDMKKRSLRDVPKVGTEGLKTLLLGKKVEWVNWEGWKRIDAEEVRLGALVNKPREKIVDKLTMLNISKSCREVTNSNKNI